MINKPLMKKLFLPLIFGVLISTHCFSQILKPIKWNVSLSNDKPEIGEEITIIFDANIENKWYLYSSDFDPDLGPIVAEFLFTANNTYQLIGELTPINPSKKFDSLWMGEYTYFKGKARFEQKIKVLSKDFNVSGNYIYQVCSDIDGKCVSFDDEFSLGKIQSGNEDRELFADTNRGTLWSIFFSAFLAGLVALLTPCVYPMIPITVSIFLKQSKNKREGIFKALIYGLSIIVFFSAIGFLISLIWGFTSLNELSTNWLFNVMIFLVFILFALSFFGLFEITLPSRVLNTIDSQADRGGILGIFFMAITLVLVSFSCTFPIVGTALINTLNGGSILEGTIAMFSFSLAFAIPFTGFAIFPTMLKSMPKSGNWLSSVKVVLGFLELALAFKFLSIADLAYHWGILDRDVFLAIWIVIFGFLGFYLLGKIKLSQEEDKGKISVFRLLSSIAVFSFVVYLIPGLWGAPINALSGFLPPMSTHNFNLNKKESGGTICDTPLYSNILEIPHGLTGYFDYQQAIDCAKTQHKPLFIDFTGHGCVNCREMEQRVWANPSVLSKLSENFIIVALYVDDRTKLPKNKWYISTFDGKTKKTMGQQNADFQINRFNNNAQPFYIILNEEEELLVSPRSYDLDIDSFITFLDQALYHHRNDISL